MRNAIALMMCAVVVCMAWINLSPATSEAQNQFGPNNASEIFEFDVVYKTAETADLIEGVTGKRIRITSMMVRSLSSTANNVYFNEEDGTDTFLGTNSTDVEALDAVGISGKAGWALAPGVVRTTETAGKGVEITLDGTAAVAVCGTYVLCN